MKTDSNFSNSLSSNIYILEENRTNLNSSSTCKPLIKLFGKGVDVNDKSKIKKYWKKRKLLNK